MGKRESSLTTTTTTTTQESYSTPHSDSNVAHLGDFSLRQCGIPRLPPRCTLSWPWRGAILITYRLADDATRYFSRRNIYRTANIVILWHIAACWTCRNVRCAMVANREISKTPSFVAVNYETRGQDVRYLRNNEAVCNIWLSTPHTHTRTHVHKRRGRTIALENRRCLLPWTWRRGQIAKCCV